VLTLKPMAVCPATPAAAIAPAAHPMTFSVIIAVYNDWLPLDSCLRSLYEQAPGPSFEVIVVDDGSDKESPESILKWNQFFPLSIVRQRHSGIPSARNAGIKASRGSVLLFVDADSRLERNCLSTLHAIVEGHPEHGSFQLELIADCSTFSGRVEELRLMTLRQHMLQTSGCIRYLNTAGFAVRAARFNSEEGLFNTAAQRGEDTLLLVNLMQRGELPFLAAGALVRHVVPRTFRQSLRKCMRAAYLEAQTYEFIASQGIRIRVTNRKRLRMLKSMWKACGQHPLGRLVWLGLATRQALVRTVSFACAYGLSSKSSNSRAFFMKRLQDVPNA
jgi:glycosyltransferase involved in cell wall biosynthesis